MEIRRNIMKDRNLESQDSTLKVNYIVNFGKNITQRRVKLNPILFRNNKIDKPNIKFKINELRKEQFNSYSNENMDFFRLDHVCECDRNNYHNIFMDKLKPINRKENFQKFNEIGKYIKYLDYLKENRLLNQNKKILSNILSEKEKETAQIRKKYYTQDVENTILPDIDKSNNNINNNSLNNNDNSNDHLNDNNNNNLNNENNNYDINIFKNRIINPYQIKQNNDTKIKLSKSLSNRTFKKPFNLSSNSYISNINDYSIQEGDKNLYPQKNKLKLRPIVFKNYTNDEEIRRLYNLKKNNDQDIPFYLAYNEINKNGGFSKRGGDISRYDTINKNNILYRNKKNDLDINKYRDMKNFNSRNFHKKNFNSVDF